MHNFTQLDEAIDPSDTLGSKIATLPLKVESSAANHPMDLADAATPLAQLL
ncbi:hypothetical protein [Glutamicibacter arilaitensis]|uniref:hypothetical protein n=1 Tax=Glutamicibacter arilaitensis TaxID=256701 RepID=UPI003A8CB055